MHDRGGVSGAVVYYDIHKNRRNDVGTIIFAALYVHSK